MELINKLKLYILYPELKDLNIDNTILNQILANKNFKNQYKTDIKYFIKYLEEFKKNNNDLYPDVDDIIKHHLKTAIELSITNNSKKYISFIVNNNKVTNKITNFNVFNDSNFEKLYSIINDDIFKENISEIISKGYSDKLVEFINKYGKWYLEKKYISKFYDKIWNIINNNPLIGNENILELFDSKMDIVIDLINKDLFDGLKYTYENIPESHDFIKDITMKNDGSYPFQQFSMEFIENIGNETLNNLYAKKNILKNEMEYKKLFEIVYAGNYDLIRDIINYTTNSTNFRFSYIPKDDIKKQFLEIDINHDFKIKMVFNKYFNIEDNDIQYIKQFLNTIKNLNFWPEDFKEKYGNIFNLLNQIFDSNKDELLNISKTLDLDKRNKYKKLIEDFEKDSNDVLKKQFVTDLKSKNQQIINTADHKQITTKDGKSVNVYELSSQPFTMLVHAIVDNKLSSNNSYVNQIVNNPEIWNKIQDGNNHLSTSLISDKHMFTYGTPNNEKTIMFGFYNLPYSCIKLTDIADVGIDRDADININLNRKNRNNTVNTITTVDKLMEKTIELNKNLSIKTWNEIVLSRIDKSSRNKIRPDFIVCMDRISENSIKAAQYFNIPIYLINRKFYSESNYINIIRDPIEEAENKRR